MWLLASTLATIVLWTVALGEEEILINGLPQRCGKRPERHTPEGSYERKKTVAPANSWPWHVGLYASKFGAYPYCGGTLIAPTWVLTAAHCMLSVLGCNSPPRNQPIPLNELNTLVVRLRDHRYTDFASDAYNVAVKHIILHPDYKHDQPPWGHDVALLNLRRPVQRSRGVEFACLPQPGLKLPVGHFCNAAGWGLIPNPPHLPNPRQPEFLMEMRTPIANSFYSSWESVNFIRAIHVGTDNKYGGICNGDSGGGLHCLTKDHQWVVYGVGAFVSNNCSGKYSTFVRTVAVLDWIKRTIIRHN